MRLVCPTGGCPCVTSSPHQRSSSCSSSPRARQAATTRRTGRRATTTTGGETATSEAPTGPAPGVTDDTIKIGVSYIDLEALGDIVDLDFGDYEATYQALFDDINASGGIHGRQIEAVYTPVTPVGTDSADAACVHLTEDEDVFAVIGYFQDDAVLCPVSTHATAVIGGNITEERYAQAEAPWFSTEPGQDAEVEAVRTMAEAGELDGNLGVFATILNEDDLNEVFLPLLDELGIEPVDSAVLDAPSDDVTAQNQATAVIAERFRSEGIDQVLAIAGAPLPLAKGLEPLDYRPDLRLSNLNAINAYVFGGEPDLSILDGAVAGAIGTDDYEPPSPGDCRSILLDAGVEEEYPDPDSRPDGEPTPEASAGEACKNVDLLRQILEAAGPDLNYGTFQQAGESLGSVHLNDSEDAFTFGPYPSNDGDLPMYVFDWSPEDEEFVQRDG